jgi:OOP family OmpA-OmpF porin
MKKALLGAVAASALCLGSMQVLAADIVEPPPEEPTLSWYVSIFGGWSKADEFDGDIEYSGYDYDFEADVDDGFTAGIAAGAQISEWLRGEIELSGNWHDAGGDFDYTIGGYGLDVDGDVDALFVLGNVWWDIPVGEVFRPYLGGGLGFGRLSVDISADTVAGYDYDLFDDDAWGFAYQLGVGVAFGFADNFGLDVGYRYKVINNAEFDVDFLNSDDDFDVDYKSHNFIIGARIGF